MTATVIDFRSRSLNVSPRKMRRYALYVIMISHHTAPIIATNDFPRNTMNTMNTMVEH
jgi:hypothetical protein